MAVGVELPFTHIWIREYERSAITTLLFLVTKSAKGHPPTVLSFAKVVAFGFQDASGQNFG